MFVYTPPREKASQYKAALTHAFATLRPYTSFSNAGTVAHQQLQLQVVGLQQPFQFPLDSAHTDLLKAACQQAAAEDSNVKGSTSGLQPKHVNILNQAEWQAVLMEVVTSIVRGLELECPTTCVYADLVGLVFCEPGSRYEPLVQEWQGRDTVATLLILLPSKHAGGQVTVQHAGTTNSYGRQELPADCVNYVAFYNDCNHDIKKVTAGHRVCLVYSLQVRPRPLCDPAPTTAAQARPQQHWDAAHVAAGLPAAQSTITAAARDTAALAATLNPYMVRPGTPLAEKLLVHVSPSPDRRVKRLAMRGRTPSPPAAAQATAGTNGTASATAVVARVAATPVSPQSGAARTVSAFAAQPLASVSGASAAAQWGAGSMQSAAAGVLAQSHVMSRPVRLLPADVVSAVAALAGAFKDWVWHGSQQKPTALYLLLEQQHDDDQRRQLGAAGLKGTDAVRVQAATKAAAEAGVRLALVTLKRRQVKTEVQAEQYEHPFDWNDHDALLGFQPRHLATERADSQQALVDAAPRAPPAIISSTVVDDIVMASDWVLVNGGSYDAGNKKVHPDELLPVGLDSMQPLWRAMRTAEEAGSSLLGCTQVDTFTALAMWPKSLQDHPGWGSDNESGSKQQVQECTGQDSMETGPAADSQRAADDAHIQWNAFEAPAAKRLKSPYEQGKKAERTPEYYGRPYGFGP